MFKILAFIMIFVSAIPASWAAVGNAATTTAEYTYNYMYPYLSNQMRTELNPGVTPALDSSNPINVITRTEQLSAPRRVVARGTKSGAKTTTRAATNMSGMTTTNNSTANARMAATTAATSARAATASVGGASQRRVVPRGGQSGNTSARAATIGTTMRSGRGNASYTNTTATTTNANVMSTTTDAVSSARCLADYTECMNGYCVRANTAYNRCYCSSKLAQIDAMYQPAIDSLLKQILTLRSSNQWSDAEMNKYWNTVAGQYSGTDSWTNMDNALNINWADLESRVRGQQAFTTGHEYCVQHLRACQYMASNLRDAYRSDIARDCATYESGLQKIKNAAESIVENYND